MLCGGYTNGKPADDDCREILNEIKPKVEAQMNTTYTTFEALSYKTQVVAGINYTIEVNVGDSKKVFVKVFKPLPCNGTELELKTVENA